MATVSTYNKRKDKKEWVVSKHTFKSKVIDSLSYAGVFLGVGLVAFSLLDLTTLYYLAIIGVIISPTALIIRHRATNPKFTMVVVEGEEDEDPYEGWEDAPKVSTLKMFIFYGLSTVGIGLTTGGWITLSQGVGHFFTFTSIGLVLSVLSRYNFKKQNILGIIEDYFVYFIVFIGVVVIGYGISILTTVPIMAVALIIVGSLLTPYVLIMREKTISKTKQPMTKRKYFTMVSVVAGVGCIIFGSYSLLTASYLPSLLIVEGLILLIGGSIFHGNRGLVTLRDIL